MLLEVVVKECTLIDFFFCIHKGLDRLSRLSISRKFMARSIVAEVGWPNDNGGFESAPSQEENFAEI